MDVINFLTNSFVTTKLAHSYTKLADFNNINILVILITSIF